MIDGCEKPASTRGWCRMHYCRWFRHGDPRSRVNIVGDPASKFWRSVNRAADSECWLWLAGISSAGYGRLQVHGSKKYAHRFSYELHFGPIPDGLVVDHVCDVKACVNPRHLRAVTHTENCRRATVPKPSGATSQYRGVSRNSRTGKWRASIVVNNRAVSVGTFATELEAAVARDVAAVQHHGGFAVLNFSHPDVRIPSVDEDGGCDR